MHVSHFCVPWFFNMTFDKFSCEACTSIQEILSISLRSLTVFGLKSDAWRYCASSGLDVCAGILFLTASYFCVSRGSSHIPVFFFLVPLIISCQFFCTGISCLSSVIVHSSSHKTPNNIIGDIFISGKFGSASIACLDLVSGVLICVRTPLWYHMVFLLSFYFTLLQGKL